jgi:hypothetical protein
MVGEFDENSYEFFNENYDYKVKAFREKFFKSLDEPVSKKKVQRTLAELIYTQTTRSPSCTGRISSDGAP